MNLHCFKRWGMIVSFVSAMAITRRSEENGHIVRPAEPYLPLPADSGIRLSLHKPGRSVTCRA